MPGGSRGSSQTSGGRRGCRCKQKWPCSRGVIESQGFDQVGICVKAHRGATEFRRGAFQCREESAADAATAHDRIDPHPFELCAIHIQLVDDAAPHCLLAKPRDEEGAEGKCHLLIRHGDGAFGLEAAGEALHELLVVAGEERARYLAIGRLWSNAGIQRVRF